jgi:hypothetical protein
MPGLHSAFWGTMAPHPVNIINIFPWQQQLTCASAVHTLPWGGPTATMYTANFVPLLLVKVPPPAPFHTHCPSLFHLHLLAITTPLPTETLPPSIQTAFLYPNPRLASTSSTSFRPPSPSSTPPPQASSISPRPCCNSRLVPTTHPVVPKSSALSSACSTWKCLTCSTGNRV